MPANRSSSPSEKTVTVIAPVVDQLVVGLVTRLAGTYRRVLLITRLDTSFDHLPARVERNPVDWHSEHDLTHAMGGGPTILLADGAVPKNTRRQLSQAEARRLVDSAHRSGSHSLVLASSSDVYGTTSDVVTHLTPANPSHQAGHAARDLEEAVISAATGHDMTACSLRFPHIYGPASPLIEYVATGSVPICGDPETVVSHIYVEDAVRVIVGAVHGGWVGAFPVADADPASWSRVMNVIASLRPDVEFHVASVSSIERALKILDLEGFVIPSPLTPGIGLGWRQDQRIDSSAVWNRLGGKPVYGSVDAGIPAALAGQTAALEAS